MLRWKKKVMLRSIEHQRKKHGEWKNETSIQPPRRLMASITYGTSSVNHVRHTRPARQRPTPGWSGSEGAFISTSRRLAFFKFKLQWSGRRWRVSSSSSTILERGIVCLCAARRRCESKARSQVRVTGCGIQMLKP
ncbi:hypothetical protein B0H12DRAFT_1147487 [Mycena haematopus]|nr:hypothetical protein B0H12DRAFT_1147487 [Mycena haematopus]